MKNIIIFLVKNSITIIAFLLFSKTHGIPPTLQKELNYRKTMEYTGPSTINSSHEQYSIRDTQVHKIVLDNGMHVLVRPMHNIPKVSVYLWYNVGSKDEKDRERGIAHLIEHMIFKGTDKISESDINIVTHMLSGSCNAFTSYDYTGYLFNFPTHHWKEALPIMSDCMTNCTFNDQMLNSEMKAVIQELKMYKDRYVSALVEELTAAIFPDHPYHHPIIGYKQDLWSVTGKNLLDFYKKHYVPNNATLVVVGDVEPADVFAEAKKHFNHIPANPSYHKESYYYTRDVGSKTVTLYREIQQPTGIFTFVVPGSTQKKDHVIDLLKCILGKGKSSRLYKKIVEDSQLATSLSVSSHELFDHSLLFIAFEPKSANDIDSIQKIVQQELENILSSGVTDQELARALKQTKMSTYSLLEHADDQAYEIGKYFLATGDENYIFNCLNEPADKLKIAIRDIVEEYLSPTVMHKGYVFPLPEQAKAQWVKLQEESDLEDEKILSAHKRSLPLQLPTYANTIHVKEPGSFAYPKATKLNLSNGLKVLYAHNNYNPKINIVLELKAKAYFDPNDLQGLYTFVSEMLTEGTAHYTAEELADIIESRGMSLSIHPGTISMSLLKEDLAFGLEILEEILSKSIFDKQKIEKVRAQILAEIKSLWDEPRYFASELLKEQIYKNHPYSKSSIGTLSSIEKITHEDLVNFYKKYISPQGATIAIVGDLQGYNLQPLLEKTLAKWQGPHVEDVIFPQLSSCENKNVDYPINRDQVVLCIAGLSIDRKHPDFDKLNLFDQILGGGNLGSMSSRLFKLREETGLFYTINGSLLSGSNIQPGMALIKTIVSLDRLQEAEEAIKTTFLKSADSITEQEFTEAKHAIINTLVDNFSSNEQMAHAFLFLDKYGFPQDYFDKKSIQLASISREDVQMVVKKFISNTPLLTLRIGRMNSTKTKS